MITPNPNLLCEQAKLYHYDFLSEESRGLIPDSFINHIEQCQHCQKQINQLKSVLSQAGAYNDSERRRVNSAITVMLKLHFAYIDKRVTCQTVKPFLPGLLDPVLEIRIPTPITAHLDKCRQCSDDLETIRRLNLNRQQLHRLSQLFAEEISQETAKFTEMLGIVKSVATMNFSRITAEALKHLCKCSTCRGLLYIERQKICDSLLDYNQSSEFVCESVSATDIFDYVVPYGLDPVNDQYAKFQESLTSHLRSCPKCLAKMQQLHNTVYGIAGRPESEVVTIYHIDESAKAQAVGKSDEYYTGFPIRVEIASHEDKADVEQPTATINFTTRLKQKVSESHVKPLLKIGIAVAAVFLIGFALLLNTPTVKAVSIEEIYKAIEKVKNVYISTFITDQKEPTQELWVSRESGIYITKTSKQLILWDIHKKIRKIHYLDTVITETNSLTGDIIASIEKEMSDTLGLMPFFDISEIPLDAEWLRVDNEIPGVAEGIEIYDLICVEKTYGGSTLLKKWRVFADSKTSLPQRVEWYKKFAHDSDFTLETTMIVEYLDEGKMQAIIKKVSF